MKLASYKSTRPGVQGLFNRAIRLRVRGPYSHNEVVFEPHDGVDDFMPDGDARPDKDGALWCASSVAWERLPAWSRRRAGKRGGVRFKRVQLDPKKWDVVPTARDARTAAQLFADHEGEAYSWRLIARFFSWLLAKVKGSRQWVCYQVCGAALGLTEPWRLDTCSVHRVVQWEAPTDYLAQ